MKTPEEEITELRAKTASLEAELASVQRKLIIVSIADQEVDEIKERMNFLEDQMAAFRHEKALKNISPSTDYTQPYIPYTTPVPTESKFTPAGYLHCESRLFPKNSE